MRILVTGSRDWTDAQTIAHALRQAADDTPPADITLVHGDCPTGADEIAAHFAHLLGWRPEPHPADWDRHGRRAGPLRNEYMVSLGADLCLAFIGPCTSPRCIRTDPHPSHGASGCAELAEAAGIPTRRYTQ